MKFKIDGRAKWVDVAMLATLAIVENLAGLFVAFFLLLFILSGRGCSCGQPAYDCSTVDARVVKAALKDCYRTHWFAYDCGSEVRSAMCRERWSND